MTYMPGNKVCHLDYGVGTVVRMTHSQNSDGTPIMDEVICVRFSDKEGDFIVALAGPAIDTLIPLRDSNELCPKCGINLQGKPINEDDQHLYGATHFSNKLAVYDSGLDMTVAYSCPSCLAVWDRFTGKALKRTTPYWRKAGATHPSPISWFGPLHVYNIRSHRRAIRPGVEGDWMDNALTREIRRRWYLYPLVRIVAPILRRYYDRKLGLRR